MDNINNISENTDALLWRDDPDDFYSPSIYVTQDDGIAINVGGHVHVRSVKQWHAMAERLAKLEKVAAALPELIKYGEMLHDAYCGKKLPKFTLPATHWTENMIKVNKLLDALAALDAGDGEGGESNDKQ